MTNCKANFSNNVQTMPKQKVIVTMNATSQWILKWQYSPISHPVLNSLSKEHAHTKKIFHIYSLHYNTSLYVTIHWNKMTTEVSEGKEKKTELQFL